MASVRKRNPSDPSSTWICDYTDQSGTRRLKTFKKKHDADAYRRRVESEMDLGVHTAARASATVAEVCDQFMRFAEERLNDGRIGRSRYNVLGYATRKFQTHIGGKKFSELTVADLDALYTSMCRVDGMQPSSARDWLKIFGQVEEYAATQGYTRKRQAPAALKALKGVKSKKIRRFTAGQIYQLLAAARLPKAGGQERAHCMLNCYIYLAALSGLRFGEIQGLTTENLDLDERIIRIRHNLTAFGEHKGPKTESGVRDFPMPAPVHALLTVWLDRFHVPNSRGLVFGSKKGKPIAQPNFRTTYWLPLLEAAGLNDHPDDPFHFHALRGFAASWMFSSGFGINEVPGLMGHKHLDTTLQHYTHSVVDGRRHRAMIDKAVLNLLAPPALTDTPPEQHP